MKKVMMKIKALVLAFAMIATCITTANFHEETILASGSATFGSGALAISAGTYDIPVSLKNASDITKASAAASCIKGAKLTVEADNTAKLTVEIGSVTMFGLVGYASDWKIYQENNVNSQTVAASETTTDGHVSSITFTIPDNSFDGVYVNMYVDAMQTSVNAYMAFDYSYFKDVTLTGVASVSQFGGYNVNTTVTVHEGKIKSVSIEGSDFAGNSVSTNKSFLSTAIEGLQDKFLGLSTTDVTAIESIDVVSGATYSSNAIKNSMINALGLTASQKESAYVPESVEPGYYQVTISEKTDSVNHSLVENETAKAYLEVSKSGAMTLDYSFVSGSTKEPLYVLAYNGYYTDSAKTTLSSKNVKYSTEKINDYECVTEIQIPLNSLSAEYANNVKLFVPAMSNLNGEMGGINFTNGSFSISTVLTVDWTSLSKIKSVNPGKVKLSSVKALGKKKVKLTWKRKAAAGQTYAGTKYYVEYSTSKKFKKKTTSIKKVSGTKTGVTLKSLKKGKTYYVRVRAYNTATKKYGKYSSVKKVKVK